MLADKLKELRLSCALTQKQVADVLKIERSTYTCYETGKSNPPITTAKKLAKIFGVSLESLIDEDEPAINSVGILGDNFSEYNKTSDISFANLTSNEKILIANYRLLNKEDKDKIMDEALELSGGKSE